MNVVNTGAGRAPYHHGNLREELIRIGVELAVEGGPEAIGIREASRRAGVSAAAAYRHFSGQEDLREAVRRTAVERLASHVQAVVSELPDGADASERLIALGRGYIGFARAEPRLFGCLTGGFPMPEGDAESPFTRLLAGVARATGRADTRDEDQLADAIGLLSAAHGFAMLSTSGVLRDLEEERRAVLEERTLAIAVAGLERLRGES